MAAPAAPKKVAAPEQTAGRQDVGREESGRQGSEGKAAPDELSQLKMLLFQPEQAKLAALQSQCEVFAEKIGDDKRFEQATAHVLAGALRKAEVAGHREMSAAIAPMVVGAIRSELLNSRDMMVEALYPITGRLVAASVSNAFRELVAGLEKRIDALLSSQLWKLRLRAWMTGRPLSEVVLEAAQKPRVLRLLAVDRESGRLLASWRADGQAEDSLNEESLELVSGLIAAISQFSAQAFAKEHGELRQLDMGPSHILLRASARTLVAAEFSGPPDAADERRMDGALFDLIGGADPFDNEDLARLAQAVAPPPAVAPSAMSRRLLVGACAAALIAGLYAPVRDAFRARRIEAAFTQARSAQNLAAWPLTLTVDHGGRKVSVCGLAPPKADLDAMAGVLTPAAAPYSVVMRVARVADADGVAKTAQAAAAVDARVRREEIARAELAAKLTAQDKQLAAQGKDLAALENKLAALENQRLERAARDIAPPATLADLARGSAIYFKDHNALAEPDRARGVIAALAEALKAPAIGQERLRVVGFSDSVGTATRNEMVSLARAEFVVKKLVEAGVAPDKLVAVARPGASAFPQDGDAEHKTNRRVLFEPFEPEAAAKVEAHDNVPAPAAPRAAPPTAPLAQASAIYFEHKLNFAEPKQARGAIAALAEALKAPGAARRLRVVGASDPSGSAERNEAISLARAELVVKMLVAAGVAPERLVAVARPGESASLPESGADPKRNRRVFFEPLEPEAAASGQAPDVKPAAPPAAPLAPLAQGSVIYFEHKLNLLEPDQARRVIVALADALKARAAPGSGQERLRVVGASDPSGSAERNEKISLARAELVVKMLVAAGVAPDRLVAVARPGDGATPPESGADPKRNRRVLFEPIEPGAAP